MAGMHEYECPCCGGGLEFNSAVQKVKCPYCDTEFDMDVLKKVDEELKSVGEDDIDFDSTTGGEWKDGETADMKVYVCKSCGGEIVTDGTTGATKCPYCDNPVVMMGQFQGGLKPSRIIPFKKDKAAAKAAYLQHISGKKLLPPQFKDQNHIDEIKGVYVPFWLFDAQANAAYKYDATKVETSSDEDYTYKKTDYYSVYRQGTLKFKQVPCDSSTKMPDDLMDSIEPFDMKDAVEFQTAYLAGYLADKFDVSEEESMERATFRIKNSTEQAFLQTVKGFDTVDIKNSSLKTSDGKSEYVLLPVWILNTTYEGEKYTFAMNGQTGRMVGNLPCDKGLLKKYFFKYFAIGAAIGAVIGAIVMFMQ
ncbi:MAG: hypothetical protein MJ124_06055 [Lachnospiraceae bacterium]|nr:hypothetical protein [Lachnospiraceae bacterium]